MSQTVVPKIYDVLIIGGGPAGLANATALARQLRTNAVFDSGVYRNARATNMHNYLGFDHVPPAEFRAKARADLKARYNTTTFIDREVLSISKFPISTPEKEVTIFKAVDSASETHYGRAVVLATGVTDLYPDIEGFDDCWGRGIFHCLFCHGFEERGSKSAGVLLGGFLTKGPMALHFAHMAGQLAAGVTIYTNGDETLGGEVEALLKGHGHFKVDKRKIVKLEMANGAGEGAGDVHKAGSEIILHFADGTSAKEGFLAHSTRTKANGPFAEQLGLELTETGDYKTANFFSESNVPGVFVVGDCGQMVKAVATATSSGALAAGGMTAHFASLPKNLVIPN
ncbi:hypothetical protein HK097_002097 [Rhizophlyctis rosea]|uniref:FAD/NAD(P)-binding domain-containing protein n=1 Tax=Rhizophlyctis rosea TaxID=64517 RepID=A0AAD5WYL1_9FUNG|nr:hypothetical protein HK097_002097 [Rhizophlyctis rosea]